MVKILDRIFGKRPAPSVSVEQLAEFVAQSGSFINTVFDGEKFPGGMGPVKLLEMDYWAQRARSAEVFQTNLYGRGVVRRLVTNEINTGLTPDCSPYESIIGVPEDSLADWADDLENRFAVWSKLPRVCDIKGIQTFGALQRAARLEALVGGDVLVITRVDEATNSISVQLVMGDKIRTPYLAGNERPNKNEIIEGVEIDKSGKVVAYWVTQDDLSSKRIAAYGSRTGRKVAWLVFGTDKRHDDVRGLPLLSIVLQSLQDIDKYRDSMLRKALVSSLWAMFIKKTKNKMGSLGHQGGARRKETGETTNSDGTVNRFETISQVPGLFMSELQDGEEPVAFDSKGTDIHFGPFEAAVMSGIAWANEIPPEILTMAFSNNYSASQAAINEFKIYLNMFWSNWGETFCTPIFDEWTLSEVMAARVSAPGLIKAWRDDSKWDIYGAWTAKDWYGSIKPSTDILKQSKGSKSMVDEGWSTNAREARGLTGTKFSRNIKKLTKENAEKAKALRPMLELQKEFNVSDDTMASLEDAIGEALDERLPEQ